MRGHCIQLRCYEASTHRFVASSVTKVRRKVPVRERRGKGEEKSSLKLHKSNHNLGGSKLCVVTWAWGQVIGSCQGSRWWRTSWHNLARLTSSSLPPPPGRSTHPFLLVTQAETENSRRQVLIGWHISEEPDKSMPLRDFHCYYFPYTHNHYNQLILISIIPHIQIKRTEFSPCFWKLCCAFIT